jgi:hypothetical protein
VLSGGADGKYLHLTARALKATPSALQWRANPDRCSEVGVPYMNNSYTCLNVSHCSDLQQFRWATDFFKLLDFCYILGFVSVIKRVISWEIHFL